MSLILSLMNLILNALLILVFIRAVVSWVDVNPRHALYIWLCRVTDPLINPFRKFGAQAGGIDFAPALAMLVLWLLLQALHTIGH